MCGPLESTSPRSATITCITDSIRAATWRTVASTLARRSGSAASDSAIRSLPPGGLIVCSATANSSAFLSGKTRKMVPSAMPAASAICRVVTRPPCSAYSGAAAATIAARRSSADIGAARGVTTVECK